jgi:hypothetical protein
LNDEAKRLLELYGALQFCAPTEQALRKAEFDDAVRAFISTRAVSREEVDALVRRRWGEQQRSAARRHGQPPTLSS